jgi:hypothetical protein
MDHTYRSEASMPPAKRWTIDIHLSEDASRPTAVTRAEAQLHTRDARHLRGHGAAYNHPDDTDVPEIGDELAAARALSDLAYQLLRAVADDLEAITRRT